MAGWVQDFAAGEELDFRTVGAEPPELIRDLASAGNRGRAAKNVARDVQRTMLRGMRAIRAVPELYNCKIHNAAGQLMDHHLLLPHEYMAVLYEQTPLEFERLFGNQAALETFWAHEYSQAWATSVPSLPNVWPLGLHGDDAQYIKNGRLLVISQRPSDSV